MKATVYSKMALVRQARCSLLCGCMPDLQGLAAGSLHGVHGDARRWDVHDNLPGVELSLPVQVPERILQVAGRVSLMQACLMIAFGQDPGPDSQSVT